jgi:hypothetical protein
LLRTVGLILWSLCVLLGSGGLWYYSAQAGEPAAAPTDWPAGTCIERDPRLPTLVMVLHPKCPCSSASVEELARLAAEVDGRAALRVVVVLPPGAPADWANTALVRAASGVGSVQTYIDDRGIEAGRFGAKTSGQVFLYDRAGRLTFSGGITAGRGHAGDNDGYQAVVAALRGNDPAPHGTPVYGCQIFGTCPSPKPTETK